MTSKSEITFQLLPAHGRGQLGVVLLNAPRRLNALSLAMVEDMLKTLQTWQTQPRLHAVLIMSQLPRAFCAGGDVRALLRHPEQAERFFSQEYRLDNLLKHYAKPLLVLGNGLVYGGGWGLLAQARWRLLTPDSQLAMPETAIGFFPDVGARHFLAVLPAALRRLLCLTGIPLQAADALHWKLADIVVGPNASATLAGALAGHLDGSVLSLIRVLGALQETHYHPITPIRARLAEIQQVFGQTPLEGLLARCQELGGSDPWWQDIAQRLEQASPLSLKLTDELLAHNGADLADTLREDLSVALKLCEIGEFNAGVEARLVKHQPPHWRHADLASVPGELVETLRQPRWRSEAHPLLALR